MKRSFLAALILVPLFLASLTCFGQSPKKTTGSDDRQLWVNTLTRIADPVLTNLANNTLRKNMPYESLSKERSAFAHLEAVGRLVCGIAPWLELGPDSSKEGILRKKYIDLTVKGLANAVNPDSPDYLLFDKPFQSLVDAAFLAQGLLRAPTQIWGNLDALTQQRLIDELKSSRSIKPFNNNWLLFTSMVEAALLQFTGECDQERLMHGVRKFRDEWYQGDALYGDGPAFHMDYYNSFVIHPMLTDILVVMDHKQLPEAGFLDVQLPRLTRYAEQLERFIASDGSFPVVGRSIAYRTGCFHALSQAALMQVLPKSVVPAQVRCALSATIRAFFSVQSNFDKAGWLRVGFNGGNQLKISESYINTGSAYLCASGFLALGLPATDPFWADSFAEWTNLKAWQGKEVLPDHALREELPLKVLVDRALSIATKQALSMCKQLADQEGQLPKSIKNNALQTSGYDWWCSGFFPGQLWYLYENTPTPELEKYARQYTARVERAKHIKNNHDLGFMLNCSYGNGYRLTGDTAYRNVLMVGAQSLATRYHEPPGLIRSWDFNKNKWQYPVIIDNMMNLEFLMDVAQLNNGTRYREMAIAHADKTMKHHFRDDYSCYHVVSYDTITGQPHIKQTHQGYSDESSWARGQAWALYGYTMMYRESRNLAYLTLACNIGKYIMNHPNMPADKVPYWDFDAPDIPKAPRDASAAAIMASAYIELSQSCEPSLGKQFLDLAKKQIRSLSSPAYLASVGTNCHFALMHSTGHKPNNSEVDVPLSYADYYYVEALLRMKKLLKK